MTKQVVFNVEESVKKIGKDIQDSLDSIKSDINQAIKDAAYAAYASIVANAQAKLHDTRLDYLKGLTIVDLPGNAYLISLEGNWPNKIEDGYSAYNMQEVLLASQKMVEVGRRSGQPWVQIAKDKKTGEEHKYAYVPFHRNPSAKGKGSNMADAIKEMTAINAQGRQQRLTKTFKDKEGNPLEGKVAIGRSDDAKLDHLVKYQKVYMTSSGKPRTESIYINYRAISEIGKPWIHSGYSGAHFFQEAEGELKKQIDAIVSHYFG